MTHKTKGIVLRAVKYGETSLVISLFTELFGIQSYLLNGIRTQKKTGQKAGLFQPAALLDLEVYHNELKGLQRIKEFTWAFLYQDILSDVVKNSIALYMMELLQHTLKQPEAQPDLFYFCEDALLQLDAAEAKVSANFPLYFTLNLSEFFGFRITNNHSAANCYLDLEEGNFVADQPVHAHFLDPYLSEKTADLLRVMQPQELSQLKLNAEIRKALLFKFQDYYRLHTPDFGHLRSLPILHELLG